MIENCIGHYTYSMIRILLEPRITLATCGIVGRSIYIDIFPLSGDLRLIANSTYLAMLNVGLHLVAVSLLCGIRNLNTTSHHTATIERLACGISHLYSIDHEEIIVESFRLRFGGTCPHSVGTFLHVVEFAEVYLHLLGCGSFHAKLHPTVLQHSGIFLIADIQC